MIRLRITYEKGQELRYTGNLDMQKIWERVCRRAHLPLAYSQGFHPQPRMNLAAPLPLGMLSKFELIDIWLDQDLSIEEFRLRLANGLQPGIGIVNIELVDLKGPAIQTQVEESNYDVTLLDEVDVDDLENKILLLLQKTNLPRQRRGKKYDLRPLIFLIQRKPSDNQGRLCLGMRLSTRDGATGRPEEVLSELGIDPFAARVERIDLILKPIT